MWPNCKSGQEELRNKNKTDSIDATGHKPVTRTISLCGFTKCIYKMEEQKKDPLWTAIFQATLVFACVMGCGERPKRPEKGSPLFQKTSPGNCNRYKIET